MAEPAIDIYVLEFEFQLEAWQVYMNMRFVSGETFRWEGVTVESEHPCEIRFGPSGVWLSGERINVSRFRPSNEECWPPLPLPILINAGSALFVDAGNLTYKRNSISVKCAGPRV
jgi:hypothetical protein